MKCEIVERLSGFLKLRMNAARAKPMRLQVRFTGSPFRR
jgi:hypothetical protein